MSKVVFKGNWKTMAGKLKQKYAILTDDDLLFTEGKEEVLLGRIGTKRGKTKDEIRSVMAKL